jgi:hypothetical protein
VSRKRDELRAQERQARRARITDVLTTALPALTEAEAATVLTSLRADRGIPLRDLDEHLATHPDALTSGDPACPAVIVRLVQALRDAGHDGAVLPGCSECGRTGVLLPRFGPGGRVCQACGARNSKRECGRCGRTARIFARREEGGICYSCYRVDPQIVQECAGCGRARMPVTRRPDGGPLCLDCWTPPTYTCVSCGTAGPAKVKDETGALCPQCYRRLRQPRRTCGKCGKVRVIARRATAGNPDLCENCNLPPPAECAVCHQVKPGSNNAEYGFVCRACRPHKQSPCSLCGLTRRVHAYWPPGPVCPACYVRVLDHPDQCGHCASSQPLIARSDDGKAICGPCAGLPGVYLCPGCGTGGRLYADGRCPRCVLATRLEQHLTGPDGQVSGQLRPLLDALASADNPRGVLCWLKRSPNAHLLAELAAAGQPLSHDLLDELPPSRYEHYVRQALVHTGVLPERHEDLDRIPAWLDQILAGKPTQHARLIRPFVHWFLLKRARRRAAHRRHPAMSGTFLRTRVRVALELLTWLDEHDLALATLTQPQLERWLTAGNTRTYTIRYFLGWAADRRIAPELAVPLIPRQEPVRILDEDDRWAQLRQCLNDTTMPIDIRAAGALVLLFGLPTSRIRQLRSEHLDARAEATHLNLGAHPLLLPPKLAALLRQLADPPGRRPRLHVDGTEPGWLFPGLVPGRPAGPSGFSRKLLDHGIDSRPARNAALIALAEDLPAPILADVLGLHINTAVRWTEIAKQDWTDYLAARAKDLEEGNTAPSE